MIIVHPYPGGMMGVVEEKYSDTGLLISHFPDSRGEGWEKSRSEGERPPQNFHIFSKKDISQWRTISETRKICHRRLALTAVDGTRLSFFVTMTMKHFLQ